MATAAPSKAELWPLIHQHRAALAAVLDTVTDAEWETPSLCAAWRVRDVVAHNIDTFLMTPPRFIGKFAAAGFRFNTMTGRAVANYRDEPTTRLAAEFRERMGRSTAPPGPLVAMLGEAVIHAEDIARPLGRHVDAAPQSLMIVADYARNTSPLLHGKQRSAGLTLRATDIEWRAGEGPEVAGPIAAIISAVCGRGAALTDLSGDGVAILRTRIA
ncbi:MAG: maleylpyruvate isomerase family mycothiol-dependent enzyme [Candidatus Dormibacteraeota bacterium]|nr:maleylpyruvate isomerase family mycothiol-dependent enzyme [Candidatus Dormibacteraeota bacterium]